MLLMNHELSKLKYHINYRFAKVFIVMTNREESIYSYKNINFLLPKIRIVIVSLWEKLPIDDEYTKIIHV